jgi:hypothetical protein
MLGSPIAAREQVLRASLEGLVSRHEESERKLRMLIASV